MGEIKQEMRPDSLAPIALDKVSIDEDLAAMNKGQMGKLLAVLAVLAISGGGIVYWMSGMDSAQEYREAGKTLNGLKKTEFDQFWGCVLQGVDLRDVKSNADLTTKIRERSRSSRFQFGRQVRDRCMDTLEGTEAKLTPELFPSDLRSHVKALNDATTKLRVAWDGYIGYLISPKSEYNPVTAQPYENKIATGWYDFKKAHAELNQILRSKLQK